MTASTAPVSGDTTSEARDWVRVLAKYREPDPWRSVFELVITVTPFLILWALAWWSLSISTWLALGLAVLNAVFVVRIFMIQHDCGHGSFFRNRALSDWIGRALGVLTLTPYDVWRRRTRSTTRRRAISIIAGSATFRR